MSQQITTDTPRYEVKSLGWEHLDVFDSLEEAIHCTLDLSLKFPDTEFFVAKKINWEEEIVFKFKCNIFCKIDDIKDFYKSLSSLSQEKLSEMITWRKSDGR